MPFVDRRVVLKSRVRALPGGPGDLVPELAGLDGLRNLAVRATLERPVPVLLQRVEERVRNPHAVIRVLARHGLDRKSTRLNSSHLVISYAVFCLKKKKPQYDPRSTNPPYDRVLAPVRMAICTT